MTSVLSMLLLAIVSNQPAQASAEPFEPLAAPQRVLDTRANGETADGIGERGGKFSAGQSRAVKVAGRAGVPSDAANAILNVTAAGPEASGFLTLYPCGRIPNSSNVNYVNAQNTASAVLVKLDGTGNVCIFSSQPTNVIVDVSGTLTDQAFTGLPEPRRILDTRPTGRTVDGSDQRTGVVSAGETYELSLAGRAGLGTDPGTVVVNVTAAQPSSVGFVTVWPCGRRPAASNLNYSPGRATSNVVATAVSDRGTVCLYTSMQTNLIVDVSGTLGGSVYSPVLPQRIADTRPTGSTVDGAGQRTGQRPAGGTLSVRAAGRAGIPLDAKAVLVNVTVAGPLDTGFVTVHPRGVSRPSASNLNYVPGNNTANVAVARLGVNGEICLFTSASTHLIVDVAGYFNGPAPEVGDGSCPADPAPPPPPPLSFAPGQYVVGSQIPAGRYVMESAVSGCYWERQSGFGGTFEEIIANDFRGHDGRVMVDIGAADRGFEFDGDCGTMRTYAGSSLRASSIEAGAHVVGEHILAGTYRANVRAGCYWQRVKSFDGQLASIISNDFVADAGQQIVTIETGDVGFESNDDCGTWSRV